MVGFDDCVRLGPHPSPNMHHGDAADHPSSLGYKIIHSNGQYVISLDVSAIKASDMAVRLENYGRVIHVSGKRHVGIKEHQVTMEPLQFSEQFEVGSDMDVDQMTAILADGELTLTIPVKAIVSTPVRTIHIVEYNTHDKKST